MVLPGAAEMIKELEEEIAKEGADPDSIVVPKEGEENATQEQQRSEAQQEESASQEAVSATAEENGQEDDGSGDEEALSEDKHKRNKAFAAMRNELREANERTQKFEQEKQALAERLARLEGRAEASGQPVQRANEDAEPDALLYPDDHNAWKLRQMEKRVEAAEKIAKEAAGFASYQREERGVEILENAFKASNPNEDYEGAQKFLIERERAMKRVMNPKLSDAEADAQTKAEKVQLFRLLHAQGRDPVRAVMDLAKAQGFVAGAKPKEEAKPIRTNIDKLADNQRKSANLNGGSSASKNPGPVSPDDVLNMSFQKLLRMPKAERERIANGGVEE